MSDPQKIPVKVPLLLLFSKYCCSKEVRYCHTSEGSRKVFLFTLLLSWLWLSRELGETVKALTLFTGNCSDKKLIILSSFETFKLPWGYSNFVKSIQFYRENWSSFVNSSFVNLLSTSICLYLNQTVLDKTVNIIKIFFGSE